jgi:NTP pyrophosphatase (non-canonical NTP hydrolase)
VAERSPAVGALIFPTRLFERDQIQVFPAITSAYRRLCAAAPLGWQYEYLARLAEQQDLFGLEMTVHVDDRAFAHLAGNVRQDGDAMVLAEHGARVGLAARQVKKCQELQAEIEATFGERDRARGVDGTFRWFVEEVGEVAKALRGRDPDELRHELGDALAWLVSVANVAGVDLEEAAARFADGCPRCRQRPCTCPVA